jgi:hypothetical protein
MSRLRLDLPRWQDVLICTGFQLCAERGPGELRDIVLGVTGS